MSVRADAHAHFFQPGYVAELPERCRRVQPDEVTLYEALARQHDVQQVLAVGYEGERWAAGNNQYLAGLAASCAWVRPVAFVSEPTHLEISTLTHWLRERFVGLSFYVFDDRMITALDQVPAEVWSWLSQHRWLISVNSRGENWRVWSKILEQYPNLRLTASHLGLPPAVEQAPTLSTARRELEAVISLARYPETRVKLSGFYALTRPGYNFPHQAAWPYVDLLLTAFGARRLLWGSDFSPSLEWVSFPQTFALLADLPSLNQGDRERIEGGNLLALMADVDGS
ncbi:MAG: amidohydrolase [Anaerolineae bacterium]|nr:amidohydrolase [Anaerolineae bacterium]